MVVISGIRNTFYDVLVNNVICDGLGVVADGELDVTNAFILRAIAFVDVPWSLPILVSFPLAISSV
jgi:hypothetical protein